MRADGLECLVAVLATDPLTFHISLHNPGTAAAAVYVPRSLKPLGAFVRVEVRDLDGAVMYATQPPKFTPKLDPFHVDSYVEVEPGYSYGVLLECTAVSLSSAEYRVDVSYSNLQYRGFPGHVIGEQAAHRSIRIAVQ